MIGASKDAVASWETGRNRLSQPVARRMALAAGADAKALMRGRGPLTCHVPFRCQGPFSKAAFEQHRGTYWWRSDEAAARQHPRNCTDALGLILGAAARPRGKVRSESWPRSWRGAAGGTEQLAQLRNADAEKLRIAKRLRAETTMTLDSIAQASKRRRRFEGERILSQQLDNNTELI